MERLSPLLQQGLAHHQAGRLREAEQCYRQLLAREPNHPDGLHLLGVIATQFRHFAPAIQLIESAIRAKPGVAFYHNNLANAQRSIGDLGAAEMNYRRALELQKDYIDAQVNLGTVLRTQARFNDAVIAYQRAIQMSPKLADAHASLGTALKDQGRIDESLGAYRRAVELNPRQVDAHSNLLYALHCSDKITPPQLFEEHRQWGAQHAEPLVRSIAPHDVDRAADRRLRVGFVSADFRDHPVARFLSPLIEHRDRNAFAIVCFSSVESPDEVTARYRADVDEFYNVAALNDEQLAGFIREKRVDILVDLAGHTAGGRLLVFARKPAPVQVTYLGYPDTTGIRAMDLRITDELTDPAGAEDRHIEKLARIDGCFVCYPLAAELPTPGRADRPLTFGSFNNLSKISTTTMRLWTQVLDAVPGARMIIKTTTLGDAETRSLAAQRFADAGLPMDRVELLGPLRSQREHLETYARVDIALDTFPYNGTTTTCEALSMNVPVVSLYGAHHASRVGLSVLTAAGFPQWATNDPAQFVEIAKELAQSRPSNLRERMQASPLCDGSAFSRKFEGILRDAWTNYVHQYNPRP